MNYFEILDLGAEPFSNSPDPDFLYRSSGHEQCLHGLEIALRLRRGLCVVLGEVGTGKTTLCRELLRILDEDETVSAHLLLDPGFSSPHELLAAIHAMVVGGDARGLSEWQLKEGIKNAIFRHAAEDDTVLALIVDEGQKLPCDCLEVLRELLNYETNDRKLLQIVIFAQTEFDETLAAMPNLADRVNDLIRLKPLGLAETKAMVRHRLDRAKSDYRAPELFTPLGYMALQRITGGYPRRVVRLAHKVVLALIMQERRKAGWRLVRACARDNEMAPGRRSWAPALVLAACLAGVAVWAVPGGLDRLGEATRPLAALFTTPTQAHEATPLAEPAVAEAPTRQPERPEAATEAQRPDPATTVQGTSHAPEALAQAATAPPEPPAQAPALLDDSAAQTNFLGTVAVHKGESIALIARAVYGGLNKALLAKVVEANMRLGDPTLLQAGDVIRLPMAGLTPRTAWWVPLDEADSLAGAVNLWRATRRALDVRILAHRAEGGELRFSLIAGWPRGTEDAARTEAMVAGVEAAPVHGEALLMADI